MGTFFMIIFHLLSGGVSNPAAVNQFIAYIQYASPNRYSVQLFYGIMVWETEVFNDVSVFTSEEALSTMGFSNFILT